MGGGRDRYNTEAVGFTRKNEEGEERGGKEEGRGREGERGNEIGCGI